MKKNIKKIICGIGIVIIGSVGVSAQNKNFNQEQKKEIGEIVREYLLQNPQLFFEIQEKLDEYHIEQTNQHIAIAIDELKDEIFNAENQAIMGNPNATVKVVEFFDYNCIYCKLSLANLETLVKQDNDVKIILKEFPVFGEESIAAAKISSAVNRMHPKKYAQFHTKLLKIEGKKNTESAIKIAKEMGINIDKLLNQADKQEIIDELEKNRQIAQELAINATPAFIIGNEVVLGNQELKFFTNKINNIKKCGNTQCS